MKHRANLAGLLLVCLCLPARPAPAAGVTPTAPGRLLAGTARADITPPADYQAVDLSNRPLAPRERLEARALVLRGPETSVALVTIDLILFASRRVVAEAQRRYGLDHVILSASHTHAAPAPAGLRIRPPLGDWTRRGDPGEALDWDALSDDPWYAATEAAVLDAIGRAAGNLFPAHITAGRGPLRSAHFAHNRRLVRDGKFVRMLWDNPTLAPTEPVDQTVGVIRVTDDAARPRAFLVHFACHPVATMGSGVVSRDFPGALRDRLAEELGDDCLVMFLQGASGDLDPYHMNLAGEHRWNMVREAGASLARGALAAAADLPPAPAPGTLRARRLVVPVGRRGDRQTSDVALTVVLVNDDLALVTIPGEPFIQHQLDLRAGSPVPHAFMLGLAYSGAGSPFLVYLPTARAAAEGGYSASECSFVAPEAGAQLVEAALGAIASLAGGRRAPAGGAE